jgi:cyclopropane-fatty-acyl-phospholipid synthase
MNERSLAVPAAAAPAATRTASFLERVFPSPRSFGIRLWNEEVLPASGPGRFTLVLTSPGSLRRMFAPPVELSMGEAYLRGDFVIEGDLSAAFDLVPAARAALRSPREVAALALDWLRLPASDPAEAAWTAMHDPARLRGRRGSRDRDRSAIQYHYDVGNDFYRLFLDRRMVYSCAYFPTGTEELDAAQEAKLELICRKLRLREGERLLDIGCGWGGMLMHAAQRHGVEGLGVTLSRAQLELGRERIRQAGLEGRVRLELCDYRDLGGRPFDKIVSVGMFEHVGRIGLPEYFAKAYGLLAPGGLFLNHGISDRPRGAPDGVSARARRAVDSLLVGNFQFRTRYIFPDGELVPVSEANLEAERAGFEIRDVENLREHYALTVRHWLRRLRSRRDEATGIAGEPIYRLWELYLAGCIHHFDAAKISINQSLLARPREGQAGVPWSRADLYRS